MRGLDVVDDYVRISLDWNSVVAIILHQACSRCKKIVPAKRCSSKVWMQLVHDLVHPKDCTRIFKDDHHSNCADLVLRMSGANHSLCVLDHHADVCSLFLCLQLWNIEHKRLRIIPIRKKMKCKVIQMQRQWIVTQKEKWTGHRKSWKTLDWQGNLR